MLIELLLRREPIFTSESGSKQNLSSYFLWESKTRPIKEIAATQVREEANEEEIKSVASLAEMCLRLRGEERPTMKELEMKLQYVRSRRLRSCQAVVRNEDLLQPVLTAQSGMVNRANLASQRSQNCYNLEQEFMASTTLPR